MYFSKIKILLTGIAISINEFVFLIYSEKQNYFCNLNVKDLNDNNKFWKKIKAFFSDKGLAISTIVLKEKVNSITAYKKPAIFFNIGFIYTTY